MALRNGLASLGGQTPFGTADSPSHDGGVCFMIPVYQAGRQVIKIRAVMVLSLVCFALLSWLGYDLALNLGAGEADGGILAPLPERLAWAGLVVSLGIAFVAGMWLYGSIYAA